LATGLPYGAILAASIAYSSSVSVLYRSNEGDKHQGAFAIAGVIIAALLGLFMSASGTDIVLQYVAWGIQLALLLSWGVHSLLRRVQETREKRVHPLKGAQRTDREGCQSGLPKKEGTAEPARAAEQGVAAGEECHHQGGR
jgi:uncharacterized membrane protein YfcA